MAVDVIELQPPGKILEWKFAVRSAAEVLDYSMEILAARFGYLISAHRMGEHAPLAVALRNPRTKNQVVLGDPCPVKAAAVQNNSQVSEPVKRKCFRRPFPSPKCKTVHHMDVVAETNSAINVSTRQQLRFRCGGKQHQAQERQNQGCGFRHENKSSPGDNASS